MTDQEWQLHPSEEDLEFDLALRVASLVSLRSQIPADALSAESLGTERSGNGVVIESSGLILTIGYLISEAESIWITDEQGRVSQGMVTAYDQPTGFGLVQPLASSDLPAIPLGDSTAIQPGEHVIVCGNGNDDQVINALVTAKREFAGYWEYVLDEAIFTAPAHPNWGGAAMLNSKGELCGIGSLLVQQVTQTGETIAGNMMVPIDILKPVLDELKTSGKRNQQARPWMGMLIQESSDELTVISLHDQGPAQAAGIQVEDRIVALDDIRVDGLANLFRRVWDTGPAGCILNFTIQRDDQLLEIPLLTIDRSSRLKTGTVH